MTKTSTMSLPDMLAMRERGADFDTIAAEAGLKPMTAYQRLRRQFGLYAIRPRPEAANDNNPDRTTKMMPRNGGCSTTSGEMPVSLARVPTMDTAEVTMSPREIAAEMAPREMAVAA